MAIVSWIVGGAVGVAIAIGILSVMFDSGSSRKRSQKNRTNQVASASSSVPSTTLPRRFPSALADTASDSGSTSSVPRARREDGQPENDSASTRGAKTSPSGSEKRGGDGAAPRKRNKTIDAIAYPMPVVRVPAPSPEERKAAEERLREVFREEFAAATEEEAKRELALDLLRREPELSEDSIALFTSLKAAYDLAIDGADPALARHAVDRMAEKFEIDEVAVRSHILFEIEEEVRSDVWRIDAGCEAIALGKLCLEQGRLDEARQLSDLALRQGEATKSSAVREAAAALRAALLGETEASTALAEAKERYQSDPGDVDAAERYGRLLCLEQGAWERGLPLLAESEDPQIRAAAEMDLATPMLPSEKVATADAWWLVAERGEEFDGFYTRSKRWYQAASEEAAGLDRVQARKRLDELAAKAISSGAARTAFRSLPTPVAASVLEKNDLWDLTQGADITKRSEIAEGSDIRSAFGASLSKSPLAPQIKDGTLFEAAPGGTVHYVEWTTGRHVKAGRIDIVMRSDLESRYHGHAESIRIFAWDPIAKNQALIVDLPAREEQYARPRPGVKRRPASEPGMLSLTVEVEPVIANKFRAEFVQAGTGDAKYVGPLVMELDAFPPSETLEGRPLHRPANDDGEAGRLDSSAGGGFGGSRVE